MVDKKEILSEMVNLASELRDVLRQSDLTEFGALLHKNWLLKKQLASGISNPILDQYYDKALQAGALGGKILGAGGGGFLLFYCDQEKQAQVKEALKELLFTRFKFESEGSKIIYTED